MDALEYPLYQAQEHEGVFIQTPDGILTALEVVLGLSLFIWLLYSEVQLRLQRFVCATGWAYGFNGLHILATASYSPLTGHYLPTIFYGSCFLSGPDRSSQPPYDFLLYQATAAASLLTAAAALLLFSQKAHRQTGHGALTLACGAVHGGHFGYTLVRHYLA